MRPLKCAPVDVDLVCPVKRSNDRLGELILGRTKICCTSMGTPALRQLAIDRLQAAIDSDHMGGGVIFDKSFVVLSLFGNGMTWAAGDRLANDIAPIFDMFAMCEPNLVLHVSIAMFPYMREIVHRLPKAQQKRISYLLECGRDNKIAQWALHKHTLDFSRIFGIALAVDQPLPADMAVRWIDKISVRMGAWGTVANCRRIIVCRAAEPEVIATESMVIIIETHDASKTDPGFDIRLDIASGEYRVRDVNTERSRFFHADKQFVREGDVVNYVAIISLDDGTVKKHDLEHGAYGDGAIHYIKYVLDEMCETDEMFRLRARLGGRKPKWVGHQFQLNVTRVIDA